MIKKYKSITSIVLLLVIFFQFNFPSLIHAIGNEHENDILYTPKDFVVEDIIVSDSYIKTSVVDKIKNTTEFVEVNIFSDYKEIIVKNELGEILWTSGQIPTDSLQNFSLNKNSLNSIGLMSYGNWTDWYISETRSNLATNVTVGIAVGIVVSVIVGPIIGSASGVAALITNSVSSFISELINDGIPVIYYRVYTRVRSDRNNSKYEKQRYAKLYRYFDYTGPYTTTGTISWVNDYSGFEHWK